MAKFDAPQDRENITEKELLTKIDTATRESLRFLNTWSDKLVLRTPITELPVKLVDETPSGGTACITPEGDILVRRDYVTRESSEDLTATMVHEILGHGYSDVRLRQSASGLGKFQFGRAGFSSMVLLPDRTGTKSVHTLFSTLEEGLACYMAHQYRAAQGHISGKETKRVYIPIKSSLSEEVLSDFKNVLDSIKANSNLVLSDESIRLQFVIEQDSYHGHGAYRVIFHALRNIATKYREDLNAEKSCESFFEDALSIQKGASDPSLRVTFFKRLMELLTKDGFSLLATLSPRSHTSHRQGMFALIAKVVECSRNPEVRSENIAKICAFFRELEKE